MTLRWRDGRSTKLPARGEIAVDEGVAVALDVNDRGCLDDIESCAAGDIQILEITLPRVDDDVLRRASHLTELIVLRVPDASGISDEGVRHLLPLTGLRELRLKSARRLSDAALETIAELSGLAHLSLTQSRISDAGLELLGGLTNLTHLVLDGSWQVNGDGLAHLARLPNIERLWLRMPRIKDEHIAHLSGLTTLRVVGLPSQVTAEAFYHLPRNAGLRVAALPTLSKERIRELAADLPHLDFGIRWTEFDPATASVQEVLTERGVRIGPLPDPHAAVLVMFTGEEDAACDELRSVIKQVSALHPNRLGVFEIDATAVPTEAAALHISSVPMLVLFANGRPVVRFPGATLDEVLAEISPRIGVATKAQ